MGCNMQGYLIDTAWVTTVDTVLMGQVEVTYREEIEFHLDGSSYYVKLTNNVGSTSQYLCHYSIKDYDVVTIKDCKGADGKRIRWWHETCSIGIDTDKRLCDKVNFMNYYPFPLNIPKYKTHAEIDTQGRLDIGVDNRYYQYAKPIRVWEGEYK